MGCFVSGGRTKKGRPTRVRQGWFALPPEKSRGAPRQRPPAGLQRQKGRPREQGRPLLVSCLMPVPGQFNARMLPDLPAATTRTGRVTFVATGAPFPCAGVTL